MINFMKKWHKNNPDYERGVNSAWFGRKHSEETKIKMSEKRKLWHKKHPNAISGKNNYWFGKSNLLSGKNNPMYGRFQSDKTKKKISISRTGKCKGKENPMYGKKHLMISIIKMKNKRLDYIKKHPDFNKGKNHPMFGLKGSLCSLYGRKLSKATKKIMSEKRIEYFLHNPPTYPKPYFVEKLGHKVRSSWEEEIGLLLKNNNIKYEYEPDRIDLGDAVYIPDFKMNPKLYVEVKGRLFPRNRRNLLKMKRLYPEKKVIGVGDGDKRYYNIHLKWEERDRLPNILREEFS